MNRFATETFENSMELFNGDLLEVEITYTVDRRLYDTGEAAYPEPVFRVNGKPVLREELPRTVTAEVIDALIDTACVRPFASIRPSDGVNQE